MTDRKCTVAIPVYNRRGLINQAVESALDQDVEGLEVLVVDNCSTDGTWEVLQGYRDPRLRLVRNPEQCRLFENFNRCLELSQGEYLRLLCSDDRLAPGCLEGEMRVLEATPRTVVLNTRGERLDPRGRHLGWLGHHFRPGTYAGREAIRGILSFQVYYGYNPLNYPSGLLLRKAAALNAGGFDVRMRLAGDVDLFLRMLEIGDLTVTEQIGCQILIHSDQEGARLLGEDLAPIREQSLLTERYRALLEERGTYLRIRRQLGGYALALAFRAWRLGLSEASARYFRAGLELAGDAPRAGVAALRLVALRLLLKATGFRFVPRRV